MKAKLRIMTNIGILLVFMLFCSTAFGQEGEWVAVPAADKLVNPLKNDPKAADKGEKIYNQLCWTCHGKQGFGDGPLSKGLNPKPANHTSEAVQKQSDGAIYWKITNGREAMPAWGNTLSKTQRWQLTEYVRKLGGD